jgi:hypothetical protein
MSFQKKRKLRYQKLIDEAKLYKESKMAEALKSNKLYNRRAKKL